LQTVVLSEIRTHFIYDILKQIRPVITNKVIQSLRQQADKLYTLPDDLSRETLEVNSLVIAARNIAGLDIDPSSGFAMYRAAFEEFFPKPETKVEVRKQMLKSLAAKFDEAPLRASIMVVLNAANPKSIFKEFWEWEKYIWHASFYKAEYVLLRLRYIILYYVILRTCHIC
jgi:hypothetical protein